MSLPFLIYQTDDGHAQVKCKVEAETIWLTQSLMAELFDRSVRTINEHLQNIYDEQELPPEATIRKFRIVRQEGSREVARHIDHYNLEAIIAVGFRVKSPRGTQSRRWANTQLKDLKRIVPNNELEPNSVIKKCLRTASDGKNHQPNHYNLSEKNGGKR